jgi:hypothetical protein
MGPELSPETLRRIDILFSPVDREAAKALLYQQCGNNLRYLAERDAHETERLRFAALKASDGKLALLERAVKLGQTDFRDLLMAADFGEVGAHLRWRPKPAGEPSEIDPPALGEAIHARLATVLEPLGFERSGDEWRRGGELPQSLGLETGLASRVEVKFFLKATLEAERLIVLRLPKLPARMGDPQGYIFRARGDRKALCQAVAEDVLRYVQPLFQRFTSLEEVRRGFADGTFKKHIPVQGQVWLL